MREVAQNGRIIGEINTGNIEVGKGVEGEIRSGDIQTTAKVASLTEAGDASVHRLMMTLAMCPPSVLDENVSLQSRAKTVSDIFQKQGDPRTVLADLDLAMQSGRFEPSPLIDTVRVLLVEEQLEPAYSYNPALIDLEAAVVQELKERGYELIGIEQELNRDTNEPNELPEHVLSDINLSRLPDGRRWYFDLKTGTYRIDEKSPPPK